MRTHPQNNRVSPIRGYAHFLFRIGMLMVSFSAAAGQSQHWRISLDSGLLFAPLDDLNRIAGHGHRLQELQFDRFLDYLQSIGKIRSWSGSGDDRPERAGPTWPLTLSIQYRLTRRFSISFTLAHLRAGRSRRLDFQYERVLNESITQRETLTYSPFSLTATAWVPKLAIQWRIPLGPGTNLEPSLAAGPLFAACHWLQNWDYSWDFVYTSQGQVNPYLLYSSSGSLEMKGTGLGLDMSADIRLTREISERVGFFLGIAYGFRRVNGISGSGREVRDGQIREWRGRWGMRQTTFTAPWGSLEEEVPSNDWTDSDSDQPARDFILDFSGFSLQGGLFFRF